MIDLGGLRSTTGPHAKADEVLAPIRNFGLVWEAIGRTNATPERNVSLDDHSYRLVMLVGVQPERAEVLINDTAGTAQRFI